MTNGVRPGTHLGQMNLCSGGAITENREARHATQFSKLPGFLPRKFVYSEVGYRSFFRNPWVSRRSGLALISGVTLAIFQPLLYAVCLGRASLCRPHVFSFKRTPSDIRRYVTSQYSPEFVLWRT